jgi:hypothetical protein
MPLSISSSEPPKGRRTRRAIITLISAAALLLSAAEYGARFEFPRISRIQRRIRQDQRDALAIGAPAPGAVPVLLLVGNSLLLHGLDYPAIRADLAPDARVVRFTIEQTAYLDWYYGMRHLFRLGVRPSIVVLCLNLGQTLDPTVGEYSAGLLFGVGDLFPAARDAGLDTTQASGLVFSRFSAFYADRASIRNYILNISAPGYASVLHELGQQEAPLLPVQWAVSLGRSRLRAFRELCWQNGADFILLVPPAISGQDELLAEAGALEGVEVDTPVAKGKLGPAFFRDGTHLNGRGAGIFTDALAHDLRVRLNSKGEALARR